VALDSVVNVVVQNSFGHVSSPEHTYRRSRGFIPGRVGVEARRVHRLPVFAL